MHTGKELEAHYVEKGCLSCDCNAPQVGSARSVLTRVIKVNRRKTRPYCIFKKWCKTLSNIPSSVHCAQKGASSECLWHWRHAILQSHTMASRVVLWDYRPSSIFYFEYPCGYSSTTVPHLLNSSANRPHLHYTLLRRTSYKTVFFQHTRQPGNFAQL